MKIRYILTNRAKIGVQKNAEKLDIKGMRPLKIYRTSSLVPLLRLREWVRFLCALVIVCLSLVLFKFHVAILYGVVIFYFCFLQYKPNICYAIYVETSKTACV